MASAGGAVGSHDDQNAEIIRTLFASVSAGNYDEMARLFAEDIEFDTPFAPDDYDVHVVGRGPLKEVLTGIGSTFEQVVFEVDRTYSGADGETIVVEYHQSRNCEAQRQGVRESIRRYLPSSRRRDRPVARVLQPRSSYLSDGVSLVGHAVCAVGWGRIAADLAARFNAEWRAWEGASEREFVVRRLSASPTSTGRTLTRGLRPPMSRGILR
jgi:ketosteroid isomerase-like protein